jgi:hypothetical protein
MEPPEAFLGQGPRGADCLDGNDALVHIDVVVRAAEPFSAGVRSDGLWTLAVVHE